MITGVCYRRKMFDKSFYFFTYQTIGTFGVEFARPQESDEPRIAVQGHEQIFIFCNDKDTKGYFYFYNQKTSAS